MKHQIGPKLTICTEEYSLQHWLRLRRNVNTVVIHLIKVIHQTEEAPPVVCVSHTTGI